MKRQHVSEPYFVDGGSTTKDAIIDYLFKKRPRYLRAEAIDKLFPRDQIFLVNLMETGKVSETKHGKTKEAAKNHNLYTHRGHSNVRANVCADHTIMPTSPSFDEIIHSHANSHTIRENRRGKIADNILFANYVSIMLASASNLLVSASMVLASVCIDVNH
jgi:hypothetical protein